MLQLSCARVLGSVLLLGMGVPAVLQAQSVLTSVTGQTSASSTFDPVAVARITPREPVTPANILVPRPSVLPPDEYQKRKSPVTPRAPGLTPQPPVLSFNDGTSGTLPQVQARIPLRDTPSVSFETSAQTNFQPPSPNMAAGPDDLIQIVNSQVLHFSKTGQKMEVISLPVWFNDLKPLFCASGTFVCLVADPSVRYDQLHGRFIIVCQARDPGVNSSYILISVSNGASYASGWKNWAMDAKYDGTTLTNNWADFPQVGFDTNCVYISALMFDFPTTTFQYSKLRIVRKSDLYNPATKVLSWREITNFKNEDGSTVSTLQPLHVRGRVGVGPPGAMIINASDKSFSDYFTLWTINDPTGPTPTATRTTIHGLWPYDFPAPAPQLGSNVTLDTGQSSILKAIYRDGFIFTAQNVKFSDEPATVTYVRLDAAAKKVTLQSRFTKGYFFYPAFDVPATLGPLNDLPNKTIAGTTTNLSTGALTYPGITDVKAGEDFFDTVLAGSSARWGDFFGGAIDPVTGGLWVNGQYAKPHANGSAVYGTWGAFFPWSSSPSFDDVPAASVNFDAINVMKLWGLTTGCSTTPALYCPTSPVTRENAAVFIIRAIYGDTFTFTTTPYFTDVPATHRAFSYIQKFRDLGLTVGCTTTKYCPDDTAQRQQIAVFIVRGKMKGLFGDNFTFPTTPYFTDVAAADPNYSYIQKFRELGITQGCTATAFCPQDAATREMMATFIVRAFMN